MVKVIHGLRERMHGSAEETLVKQTLSQCPNRGTSLGEAAFKIWETTQTLPRKAFLNRVLEAPSVTEVRMECVLIIFPPTRTHTMLRQSSYLKACLQ